MREAGLPGHGQETAPVRFGMVCGSTWDRARRVIVKAEHTARGANPRFVVTNLSPQTDRYLYTRLYCARGDMENRIKNQQMDLFADRASCHRFWSNQFRQLTVGSGLYADGGTAPPGAGQHGTRRCQPEPHPPDSVADRCGGAA